MNNLVESQTHGVEGFSKIAMDKATTEVIEEHISLIHDIDVISSLGDSGA